MSSKKFPPCPQVLKTETDFQKNKILHLDDGTTHTVPPGFQADCNNGKYVNVPILTRLPKTDT